MDDAESMCGDNHVDWIVGNIWNVQYNESMDSDSDIDADDDDNESVEYAIPDTASTTASESFDWMENADDDHETAVKGDEELIDEQPVSFPVVKNASKLPARLQTLLTLPTVDLAKAKEHGWSTEYDGGSEWMHVENALTVHRPPNGRGTDCARSA